MKFEVKHKKIISFVILVSILLSALVYNLLYINNKKNEIIEDIEIEENIEKEEIVEEKKTIFVDVSGEVVNPGLYELNENARINDAINIAGGVTEKADLTTVNLAYILSDAMKIIIPKKEVKKTAVNTTKKAVPVVTKSISTSDENQKENNEIININTATKEELKTLSGIGDATADKIIDYRSKNGKFSSVNELKNVSGIGDSKFEKLKEKICI